MGGCCTDRLSLPIVAAVIVTLVGAIGLALVVGFSTVVVKPDPEYAVVVDAGSSHSEFVIYMWYPTHANVSTRVYEVPKVEQAKFSCSTDKGISMYDDPQDSANSLAPCLKHATEAVPPKSRTSTPVYLRATAGMRVLHNNDPDRARAILNACTHLFQNSALDGARSSALILPGSLEGGFGWITSNYVDKQILPKYRDSGTAGALDLGGASTQITFDDPSTFSSLAPGDRLGLHLFGYDYHLYTHSYLCYGMNAARQRTRATILQRHGDAHGHAVVDNPCLPKGYAVNLTDTDINLLRTDYCSESIAFSANITSATLVGTSNTTGCRGLSDALVDDGLSPRMGTGQPAVPDQPFFAFSGYYYLVDFLCGGRNASGCTRGENGGWHMAVTDMLASAADVCAESVSQLRKQSPSIPDKFLTDYCFQGHYVATVLTHGYEFSVSSTQIEFVKDVRGRDVGWTLGSLLYQSTEEDGKGTHRPLKPTTLAIGVTFACVALVIGILLVYRAFRASRSDYVILD